uniref:Uncharacterized protein n=1 Tax=Ciona savignyi TaxID=51511 RepID=H2YUF0_CIOSA
MEDATLDETTSTGIRPLPRRTLPPLQSGDKLENSNTTMSTDKSPSKQSVTPRKRRPKRQNVESTSQPAMENSSRSLPVPSSTSLEGGAELSPNTSATSTTASGNARARRRQGNRKTRKTPSPDVISNGHALTVNEEDVVPVERLDEVLSMTTLPGVPGKGGANS